MVHETSQTTEDFDVALVHVFDDESSSIDDEEIWQLLVDEQEPAADNLLHEEAPLSETSTNLSAEESVLIFYDDATFEPHFPSLQSDDVDLPAPTVDIVSQFSSSSPNSVQDSWGKLNEECLEDLRPTKLESLPDIFRGLQSPSAQTATKEIDCLLGRIISVTPDSNSDSNFQTPVAVKSSVCELQVQYERAQKKLSNSMRRSDATRALVKRQKIRHTSPCKQKTSFYNDTSESSRLSDPDFSRRKLLSVLNRQCQQMVY